MLRRIKKVLKKPFWAFLKIFAHIIPDKVYIKWMYRAWMGKGLNLEEPKSFTEKIQWLKLYNRKPEYTTMVDKYAVKKYVAERIGEEYIIPTLGVWERPEDIDFESLPDKFVLKTCHGGGSTGVIICKNKSTFDQDAAIKRLKKSMKSNIYMYYREWPYKNVPRRIIAEQYMEDSHVGELRDYKFFCFGGQCKCFKVDFDRFIEHHANYYNAKGSLLKFGEMGILPKFDKVIEMPKNLNKMIDLANELSRNTPFLRVDFYDIDGKVYFGELTFFPASGLIPFEPKEWDEILGSWIDLGGGKQLLVNQNVICIFEPTNTFSKELSDYKFYCFNGVPTYCQVIANRSTKETIDFFDMEWNHMEFVGLNPMCSNALKPAAKPMVLPQMIEKATELSKGIPFLRVDFYYTNNKFYFGELTLYPASGIGAFTPHDWDEKLGQMINLPSR